MRAIIAAYYRIRTGRYESHRQACEALGANRYAFRTWHRLIRNKLVEEPSPQAPPTLH